MFVCAGDRALPELGPWGRLCGLPPPAPPVSGACGSSRNPRRAHLCQARSGLLAPVAQWNVSPPPSPSDCSVHTWALPAFPVLAVTPSCLTATSPGCHLDQPLSSTTPSLTPQGKHGGKRGARLLAPHPRSWPFRPAATAALQSPDRLFSRPVPPASVQEVACRERLLRHRSQRLRPSAGTGCPLAPARAPGAFGSQVCTVALPVAGAAQGASPGKVRAPVQVGATCVSPDGHTPTSGDWARC